MSYSQSFQKELPGIAGFLRVAALAGFIIIFMMVDWNQPQLCIDNDDVRPLFKLTEVLVFLASLATFFEVLGNSEVKRKKVVLGVVILIGGQFSPLQRVYSGDWIYDAGLILLMADFLALGWISILIWRPSLLKKLLPWKQNAIG